MRARPATRRLAAGAGALFGGFGWTADLAAMALGVAFEGLRPLTWRRTSRAEFRRWLDIAALEPLPAALAIGALIGLGLVLQALQLLREFGQEALVREIVIVLTVEQIAPVAVGLLVIGRTGLLLFEEIAAARRSGELDALEAMGVDPFLLLITPRIAATAAAAFAHFIFLVATSLFIGYGAAKAAGVAAGSIAFAVDEALGSVGGVALAVSGFKAWAIGLVVASAFAATALDARPSLPAAFLRAFTAMLTVGVALTVLV